MQSSIIEECRELWKNVKSCRGDRALYSLEVLKRNNAIDS